MKNVYYKLKIIPLFTALLLFLCGGIYAQTKSISGTVTDTNGESLPGVTVTVKGTSKGTITGIDGKYSISASASDVLLFSFIGMKSNEEAVGNRTVVNVQLEAETTDLQEVQVIAYGQIKKMTVTGAITSIDSEQLTKSPNASVANSLAGKVTGLSSVQFSGQPGADDPTIFVRGIASLDEDRAAPLMIVDGVERSFSQLDPDEIESISVLKDASATAVYGVRGANGVIIVTTKRGKEGPAKISANISSGFQAPTRLLNFTDSYTYAQMYNEAQLNDNPGLSPGDLRFTEESLNAFLNGTTPLIYPDMDWVDYILKPSAMQSKTNLSIRGGTKKVRYFVALGYLKQDGLFRTFATNYDYNFSYKRYNYRTNIDIDLTNTTKIGVTVGGRVGNTNQPNTKDGMDQLFRLIYWAVPFSGPGIVDGKYILEGDTYISDNKKDGLDPFYGRGFTNVTNNNLNFDIDLKQKLNFITEGLSFRTKFAYNANYRHTKTRSSSVAKYEPYYRKDVDPDSPDDNTIVFKKINSDGNLSYGESFGKGRNYYMEAGFDYNRRFGVHNLTALLLYNQSRNYYPALWSDIPTGLVGIAGRITYDYQTKYLIDFNIGYNGSENFAEGLRFGLFPAFSAGWIVSDEDFIPNLPFLEYLKLRASFGLVGNDKLGGSRFLYLPDSYDASSGGYNFGINVPTNQPAAAEGRIGNPEVTWETAQKQNYGFDLRLFSGNLGVNYDYFIENRKDILTYRQTVPGIVAYDLPAVNIGEVKNRGFELEIKWKQKIANNVRYWINLNMSQTENEIIFMDEIPQEEDYLYRTGHSVGQPFGYISDGFFTDADTDNPDIPDHQYDWKPGDMKYKDLNGDKVINQNDMMAIGYPVYPGRTYGANIGFVFKGLDFSMSWVGAQNTSRLLDETYRIAFGATLNRSLLQYMADGRWTPENANHATYPRMTLTGSQNNSKDSDFWLKDASYVRLKNLELGYNFKGDVLKKFGISILRAYVNGYNLLTFDYLKITDPESRTGSNSVYPLTKVYNVGFKLNF